MKINKLTLALLAAFSTLLAETHITGDISNMTFDAAGSPYFVEQDITVPAGKKVIIKDGSVFLFKPFTGLTISGHLLVQGSQDKPVVFSSVNDADYNKSSEQLANPFDWNGILVMRESGTVSFKNVALKFSVYGIKSQNPNIEIQNGIFKANGQFHFTINDKIQYVQDNIPYTYQVQGGDNSDVAMPDDVKKPPRGQGNTKTESKSGKGKVILRYTALGVGVAGLAAGTAMVFPTSSAWNYWKDTEVDPKMYSEFETAKSDFQTKLVTTVILESIGVLGLTGFGLSFVF